MLNAENLSVLDLKDGRDPEVRQLDHDGNVNMAHKGKGSCGSKGGKGKR